MGLFQEPGNKAGNSGEAPEKPQAQNKASRILHYSWFLVAAAVIVVGGMNLMQWNQSRKLASEAAEKKRLADAADAEVMGGNRFDILQFYAYPAIVARGASTDMCYSVSNAKAVKLEPPAAEVWPSQMRCMDIKPEKTTDYTLTIFDAAGKSKTQTITVTVTK
jgi:hypothetical protein